MRKGNNLRIMTMREDCLCSRGGANDLKIDSF